MPGCLTVICTDSSPSSLNLITVLSLSMLGEFTHRRNACTLARSRPKSWQTLPCCEGGVFLSLSKRSERSAEVVWPAGGSADVEVNDGSEERESRVRSAGAV